MKVTAARYRLRPERAADAAFLLRLYSETRAEEMAQTGWPVAACRSFLREQQRLQSLHFRRHYPEAHFDIVLIDSRPAGRLYWQENDQDIHIVDIALLAHHRNQGLGTALLGDLVAHAAASGKAVRLEVLFGSPAIHLYRRLGFRATEAAGATHLTMRRATGPLA